MMLQREAQQRSVFVPGHPAWGYYNDLTGVLANHADAASAIEWLDALPREFANPVTIAQLGLGAWQRSESGDSTWREVAERCGDWIELERDGRGRIPYYLRMPHTYDLPVPWYSAMAQGEAASLLVRLADRTESRLVSAQALVQPLLDDELGLRADTDHGVVLQEYPTDPPAHVLNGWVFALWGIYDVACALEAAGNETEAAVCRDAWHDGVATLASRVHHYELASGWTRYDLFPHPIVHVASPFYHRLHIAQFEALHDLAPGYDFAGCAARWEAALDKRSTVAMAVARKVGFRLIRPRKKAA
jgi:hypothetical protein